MKCCYIDMSYERLCSDITNRLPAGKAFERDKAPGSHLHQVVHRCKGVSLSHIKLVRTEQSVLGVLSTGEFGQDADSPGMCVQPGGDASQGAGACFQTLSEPGLNSLSTKTKHVGVSQQQQKSS